MDAIDRFIDAAFVDHAPWPGQPGTRDGFKAGFAEMHTSFPDLSIAVVRSLVSAVDQEKGYGQIQTQTAVH